MIEYNYSRAELFPTLVDVYEFDITSDADSYNFTKDVILNAEKQASEMNHPRYWNEKIGTFTSEDNLFEVREFAWVTGMIQHAFNDSLNRREIISDGADIVSMWVNTSTPKSVGPHMAHIHPNSYLSCAFYFNVPAEDSIISFEDPVQPRIMTNVPHKKHLLSNNSHAFVLKPTKGTCVVFPSWLRHSANYGFWDNDERRICFSANAFPICKSETLSMRWEHRPLDK
jgi:uncharacterized protein (TIGR02466 family)